MVTKYNEAISHHNVTNYGGSSNKLWQAGNKRHQLAAGSGIKTNIYTGNNRLASQCF